MIRLRYKAARGKVRVNAARKVPQGFFFTIGDVAFNFLSLSASCTKEKHDAWLRPALGVPMFANGAATAAFASLVASGAQASRGETIHANSSETNEQGIKTLKNLPDDPQAVYQEGREMAAKQGELAVDESVKFESRHGFCPKTCTTKTIEYRSSASEGINFLENNSSSGSV